MTRAAIRSRDPARTEAFAAEMLGLMNHAMLSLLVSVGHRTGLYDTMAALPPASSTEIAAAARLDERYVREWLGAMVTGRIVEYDGKRSVYHLPAEHAACLTRDAGAANVAALAQYVAHFGGVEDRVVDCFRDGGGVPTAAFADLRRLTSADTAAQLDAHLVDVVLPLAVDLPARLDAGIDVLDVASQDGHAALLMARAFPRSRVTSVDADPALFTTGTTYDLVTVLDGVHHVAEPAQLLAALRRALRPGGVFLCAGVAASSNLSDNVDHPFGPILYAASCVGLGAMWGEETARRMILEAGFADLEVRRITSDVLHNYYIARAPALPVQR